jgi:plastin-1
MVPCREIAILSILWQLFRIQLLANITIKNFPELSVLLRSDETLESFLQRSPEYVLLRWMKYHYESDEEKFTCVNFGNSMKVQRHSSP